MTPFPPIDARGMNAPLSRRAMLEQTATGFGMLGLLGMFGHKAHASDLFVHERWAVPY
jgi:hypothetical protein